MKHLSPKFEYTEWKSADDIHSASKAWLSELHFIRDEHLFFVDIINMFTPQLIKPKTFAYNRQLITDISKSQRENEALIESIKVHENKLKLLVDGIDQIKEEKDYIKTHEELFQDLNNFLSQYKSLKIKLFEIIKAMKKHQKKFIDKS